MRRCGDVLIRSGMVALDGRNALVEWVMGLRTKEREFVDPGSTHRLLNDSGQITDRRDCFDVLGASFGPWTLIGPFVRGRSG